MKEIDDIRVLLDKRELIQSQLSNLKKYNGIKLPGDVKLNGQQIYEEAVEEISKLQEEMENDFGGILEFYMN